MTLASLMSSEKVALMLAAGPSSPPFLGKVLMTLGASVSGEWRLKFEGAYVTGASLRTTHAALVFGEGCTAAVGPLRDGVYGRAAAQQRVGLGGLPLLARLRAWGPSYPPDHPSGRRLP